MEDKSAKLRELASWYRQQAERAANPAIWDARLRTAEDLDVEADRLHAKPPGEEGVTPSVKQILDTARLVTPARHRHGDVGGSSATPSAPIRNMTPQIPKAATQAIPLYAPPS